MKKLLFILPAIALMAASCGATTSDTATDTETTQTEQETTTQETPGTNTDAGSTTTTTPANNTTQASTKAFTVSGKNFSFSPSQLRVKKGDVVKITLDNVGGTHDLVIEGYGVKTPIIQSGKVADITFTADKTGTFIYYCSVGNHRQMGMQGTLIVE